MLLPLDTHPALASLTPGARASAAVAHVAANVKGNEGFAAGVSATMAADIDEYCGIPPRPKHVNEAGLAVSLIAASLAANDPAKAALVSQAERLQKLRGQMSAAAQSSTLSDPPPKRLLSQARVVTPTRACGVS